MRAPLHMSVRINALHSRSPSLKLIFFLPTSYVGSAPVAEYADRHFYRFGRFRLDRTGCVLFCDDRPVILPRKAADTLLFLVENAGNVVEKQDLLKHVWRDAFVEEGSLTRTISVLRKALEDGADGQEFIGTIP